MTEIERADSFGDAARRADGLAPVRALVEPLCRAHGVDLVSVGWVSERAGRTLRVTIERRTGDDGAPTDLEARGWGVTLSDCADLSRDISQALDHDDVVSGSYLLEVSSPGLERELHCEADFVRFRGMLARVKLAKPAPDGQRLLRGTIEAVALDAGTLTMHVDKKAITVPLADVVAANLVFEMTPAPRPSDASKGGSKHKGKAGKAGGPKGRASNAASAARATSKRSQSKGSGA